MGMRQAGVPLGEFWIVKPNGKIKCLGYARNISHPALEYSTGKRSAYNTASGRIEQVKVDEGGEGVIARLRAEFHEVGFRELRLEFKDDPRPEISAQGWVKFLGYNAAVKAGKVARIPCPNGQKLATGTPRMVIPEYPEEMLPLSVLEARKGKAAWSEDAYPVPTLESLKGSNDLDPVAGEFDG